jgi:hypothetical protein
VTYPLECFQKPFYDVCRSEVDVFPIVFRSGGFYPNCSKVESAPSMAVCWRLRRRWFVTIRVSALCRGLYIVSAIFDIRPVTGTHSSTLGGPIKCTGRSKVLAWYTSRRVGSRGALAVSFPPSHIFHSSIYYSPSLHSCCIYRKLSTRISNVADQSELAYGNTPSFGRNRLFHQLRVDR